MFLPKSIYVAALLLVLGGCAAPQAFTEARVELTHFGDSSRFGTRPDIPQPEELHHLTAAQKAHFLEYFHAPGRAAIEPYRRLYLYLEEMVGTFDYQGDTLSAAETLAQHTGNCMSLAIVTTALAQLADIALGYQLMDDQPVFEYQGDVVRKGVHVSTIVYNPQWLAAIDAEDQLAAAALPRGYRIDYFPELRGRFVANLAYSDYIALYYSNIASDAILAGDHATAYWYLREALQHDPDHAASLNMLAVVNRRVGDLATAEAIFRHGIAHAEDKLSLLKNYHLLLTSEGRHAEAAGIQQQLDNLEDPSPYRWLQLARESHIAGDWEGAINYYRRALTLGPYMHEAHLGLAQSYYAAGRVRSAERALVDATTFANSSMTRNLYEAKLATLRREL